MSKETTRKGVESRPQWGTLELFARQEIQGFLQRVLEEEVTELVGRAKSERRAPQEPRVYRNGYGKARKLTMTGGTVTVRRPRIRGSEEGFESQVLPLFKRPYGRSRRLTAAAVLAWSCARGFRARVSWAAG